MKLAICSVFDKKTGAFVNMFSVSHPAEAVREWDVVRKDPKNKFGAHPEDYTLMHIGSFDDQNGVFTTLTPHVSLRGGLDV